MTENVSSPTESAAPETGPESPAEPPEADAGVDTPGDTVEDGTEAAPSGTTHDAKLASEAAKWRREYRSAETKLTVAEARVAEMQKAEIQRLAATKLADPTDLWLAPGIDISGLLNDQGLVDPERVEEATEQILESKPHWRSRPRPVGAPAAAVTGDGKAPEPVEEPTWATLLKRGNAG